MDAGRQAHPAAHQFRAPGFRKSLNIHRGNHAHGISPVSYTHLVDMERLKRARAAAVMEKGRGVYLSKCAICHGNDGMGDVYKRQPLDIVAAYTRLTGTPELPPLWALGYHPVSYTHLRPS